MERRNAPPDGSRGRERQERERFVFHSLFPLSIDRLHIRDVEAAVWPVSQDVVADILCDAYHRECELQSTVVEDSLAEWTPLAEIEFRHALVDDRYARRVRGIAISEVAA